MRQTFLGSMVNVSTCPTCGGAGRDDRHPVPGLPRLGAAAGRRSTASSPSRPAWTTARRSAWRARASRASTAARAATCTSCCTSSPTASSAGESDDILLDVSINIAQAALGAKISVPTVDGDEALTVPAGTQAGRVLRLKGKGVPHVRRTGRGDQLVILSVEVPRTLSKDQRELFEKLGATLGSEAQPQEKSFLDSLKDLFGGIGRVKLARGPPDGRAASWPRPWPTCSPATRRAAWRSSRRSRARRPPFRTPP